MLKRSVDLLRGERLRARALRGTLLTAIAFGGSNALRLAGNLALTRILFPEAFGLMALVQVVMIGLQMFSDFGVQPAIVQNKRGDDPVFLNTAWTFQILRGIVLFLCTWALAAPVAAFYNEPLLSELLPVAGLAALVSGFNSTRMYTASRNIVLGRLTVLNLGVQFAGLLATIGLAAWMESVWALVIGGLVSPLLIAVLSHIVLPGHRNRIAFEYDSARSLFGFGSYIFFATVAGFLLGQADKIILGKFVTLEELAFYNIGFFLASVPLMLLQKLGNSILFPLYREKPAFDGYSNRQSLGRARLLLLAACFAVSAFLAIFGEALVSLLYDPRYEFAGQLLVLMAIAQLPILISANGGAALLAAGAARRFAILVVLSSVLMTLLLFIGAFYFGVVGVIVAQFVSAILFYPVLVWFIYPFGAWFPRQDIVFALLSLVVVTASLTLNTNAATTLQSSFELQ